MPLLSVVIPTLNRPTELFETLRSISESYPVASPLIEFIVCDNASDTPVVLRPEINQLFYGRIRVVRYNDRVGIVQSFSRCVSLAAGKYIQIFGDDDLAFGRLGWLILSILKCESSSSLIYINRLIGDHLLADVSEIAHPNDCAKRLFRISYSDFIETYTHWPGFITSLVFSHEAWRSGSLLSKARYPGYDFLDIILRGGHTLGEVFVIGSPLLIQRRGVQTWKSLWPQYWLIGMSRLLLDFDSDGLSINAFSRWVDNEVHTKNLIVDLLIARSLANIYGYSFWNEVSRIFSFTRFSFLVFFIQIFPPSFSRLLLRLSPNSSKYSL